MISYKELREQAKIMLGVFEKDTHASINLLVEIAIGITVLLIVVGYVLAPVGLTAFGGVNRTAAGVVTGTAAGNMWDAIVPICIAVIILSLIYVLKERA